MADFLAEAERLNMHCRLDQNVLRKLITTGLRPDIQEFLAQIHQELYYTSCTTAAVTGSPPQRLLLVESYVPVLKQEPMYRWMWYRFYIIP